MSGRNDKPDKKIAILEAAMELIAIDGFHGAPTSKIAEKAGVGVGSIYRYFQDKEELIHEIFRHVSEEMSKAIILDFDPNAPIREQYLQLCTDAFRYFLENPKVFAFNEQYFNSPFGTSLKRDLLFFEKNTFTCARHHPLYNLLQTAKIQQIVKDLPFPVLFALTLGPIVFLVRDVCAGLFDLDSDLVDRTTEACWDAVKR